MKAQFSDDIVNCDDFDVGYISGINANVTIRSREDLTEVWREVYKGSKIMLWCDGLKGAGKSKRKLHLIRNQKMIVLKKRLSKSGKKKWKSV